MYVGTKLQIHYIYNSSWDELLFDKWKIKRSFLISYLFYSKGRECILDHYVLLLKYSS